jgi:hypothetical protein
MSQKPLAIRLAARYRKNRLWSWFSQVSGNGLNDRIWVFIIGCYNSGTTLLEQILSLHPAIASLNEEGVMLTDALPRPEDYGWRRMWLGCESKIIIDPAHELRTAARIKRHWSHFYPARRYLMEKSISNTPRALFFERNFQPVYFIHLVRNGYAVAEGIMRKAKVMGGNPYAGQQHYPIEMCAGQWKRSMEVVEEAKPKLRHFLEVRYEDLTEKPLETMSVITSFLGLEALSKEMITRSFSVHEKNEPILNMNERSLARLSAAEIKKINEVAHHYLVRYGYYREA